MKSSCRQAVTKKNKNEVYGYLHKAMLMKLEGRAPSRPGRSVKIIVIEVIAKLPILVIPATILSGNLVLTA